MTQADWGIHPGSWHPRRLSECPLDGRHRMSSPTTVGRQMEPGLGAPTRRNTDRRDAMGGTDSRSSARSNAGSRSEAEPVAGPPVKAPLPQRICSNSQVSASEETATPKRFQAGPAVWPHVTIRWRPDHEHCELVAQDDDPDVRLRLAPSAESEEFE